MNVMEWSAVVGAVVVTVGGLGGLVGWMMSVYWKLASVDTRLADLKVQMILDAAEHSNEHRRLWQTLEGHEERIRHVEHLADA